MVDHLDAISNDKFVDFLGKKKKIVKFFTDDFLSEERARTKCFWEINSGRSERHTHARTHIDVKDVKSDLYSRKSFIPLCTHGKKRNSILERGSRQPF